MDEIGRIEPGRLASLAQRFLAGPGAWAWRPEMFAWQRNEPELVLDGAILRPDRLVQRKDNGAWWVLDDKSGLAPQRDPALVALLSRCRAAVQAIYPNEPVHAAFFNGDGQWIDLPGAEASP